jgi:aryl-alcohol dehydrogenase-like predicted oxidoreductase
MEYRTFGRTGWQVSEIGFGGWQLGGTWGEVDDTESIDTLLQLHGWFHRGVHELDWLETLNSLRLEGKIDRIGVSLHDSLPEQGVALAKLGLVGAIQVIFNIFEPEPLDELFPAALASGTAIIARVPLDSGSLSGTWNPEILQSWAPGDKRHNMYARNGNFDEALNRIKLVKNDCTPHYANLAEAAIRYSLHPDAVSLIISGMRNRHEVDLTHASATARPFLPSWPVLCAPTPESTRSTESKPARWMSNKTTVSSGSLSIPTAALITCCPSGWRAASTSSIHLRQRRACAARNLRPRPAHDGRHGQKHPGESTGRHRPGSRPSHPLDPRRRLHPAMRPPRPARRFVGKFPALPQGPPLLVKRHELLDFNRFDSFLDQIMN